MDEAEIKQHFVIIDKGIAIFNAGKKLRVSKECHSDWLVFDERSISWENNSLKYLIQIFPCFNERDKIKSWTLYGVVSYDTSKYRFLKNFYSACEVSLDQISSDVVNLLNLTYDHIISFEKRDIPRVLEFSK
ncbi:MAG: hypothetical protein ACTHNW_22655 [Mucilaginibacter sp.]